MAHVNQHDEPSEEDLERLIAERYPTMTRGDDRKAGLPHTP
jgi:hypothetical protein